jgi:FAD/FMN-containing dehydrogenase
VPLTGGLVVDVTGMQRVLDIGPGRVRVEGGARMHDIEMAVRETGQALRIWPSTWRVATIAGFIAGGFGGVGSTAHGVLRDSGNLLRCRVVTVESEPRVITLEGDDIQKVHHAYGTNGIITEVEVALSPAVDWVHVIALFPRYRQVLDLGLQGGQAGLVGGVGEGLQVSGVVLGAEEREGLAQPVERMQVQQHIVGIQQRAQHVADTVLEVLRHGRRAQVAVEIAVARAPAQGIRQRVGHGHEGDDAALDAPAACVQFGQGPADGPRPGHLVAVHGAQHDQARAGPQAVELVDAQAGGALGRC